MTGNPELTLQESFERLCAQNSAAFSQRDMSPEAQEFFRCHDTAHVVFGCDTSIFGEGVLKIFTIFGTTLGFWKHLLAYREANAFDLFRQYSWQHNAKNFFRLMVRIPHTIVRARKMSKPWPWSNHDEYLGRSIKDIRTEFNIEVVQPS